MESKYKRLIGNSAWNIAGNAGSKLISFLLLPFYTRWLGTDGYGFSDLITTYSTLFGGLVTLCVSDAILVFVKDKSQEGKKAYYSSSISSALVLCLVWGLVLMGIKSIGIGNGFVIENVYFIFGMIVTNFLQTSSQQMALALDKIRVYSFTGLVQCLTIFGFSWALIPKYGVVGYVYAMILANVVTSFYSVLVAGSWRFLSLASTERNKVVEILKYSIPLIPNVVMWWLVSALNRPLLESNLGLSSVGLYAVAQKFPGIVTLIFSLFSVTWTVSVLEEYGKPGFDHFYEKVFRAIFSVVVLFSLLLMFFSKPIIHLLTAPEFHEAYKYMVILILGSVFSCMSAFWGTCFSVVKKSKYFFYSSVWGAITAIVLNYLLIPRFEIYGAAFSVVVSFFVTAISRYCYSLKFVHSKLLLLSGLYAMVLSLGIISVLFIGSVLIRIAVIVVCISLIICMEKNNIKVCFELIRSRVR